MGNTVFPRTKDKKGHFSNVSNICGISFSMIIPIGILLLALAGDAFAKEINFDPSALEYDYETARAIFKSFRYYRDRHIYIDWPVVSFPITYTEVKPGHPFVQIKGKFEAVGLDGRPVFGKGLFFLTEQKQWYVRSEGFPPIPIDIVGKLVTYTLPHRDRPADSLSIAYFSTTKIREEIIHYLEKLKKRPADRHAKPRDIERGSAHTLVGLTPHGHSIEFVVSNEKTLVFTGGHRMLIAEKKNGRVRYVYANTAIPYLEFDPRRSQWIARAEDDFGTFYAFRPDFDQFVSVPIEEEGKTFAYHLRRCQIFQQDNTDKDGTEMMFSEFKAAFKPVRDESTGSTVRVLPTEAECGRFDAAWRSGKVRKHMFIIRCNPRYVEGRNQYHAVIEGKVKVTPIRNGRRYPRTWTGSMIRTDGSVYQIKTLDDEKTKDITDINFMWYEIPSESIIKLMSPKL